MHLGTGLDLRYYLEEPKTETEFSMLREALRNHHRPTSASIPAILIIGNLRLERGL